MENVICDKCGHEIVYNNGNEYEVFYLKCPSCGEVIIDKIGEDMNEILNLVEFKEGFEKELTNHSHSDLECEWMV